MADNLQDILQEAKRNKYCSIWNTLSDAEVINVWDNVAAFIEKSMLQQKGVYIVGLGTFTFMQIKLDIGNNKHLLLQRPVFCLLEKLAQTHALQSQRHTVSGSIPVVPLNLAQLSLESTYDRDTVETCVKEIIMAVGRCVATKPCVYLTFNRIGRLQFKDGKVKMKFYKNFVNNMDGSGRMVDAMQDRPGTCDSVMSERCQSVLRRSQTPCRMLDWPQRCNSLPVISETEPCSPHPVDDDITDDLKSPEPTTAGGRVLLSMPKVTGVSFTDDIIVPHPPPPRTPSSACKQPAGLTSGCDMYGLSLSPDGNLYPEVPLSSMPPLHRSTSPRPHTASSGLYASQPGPHSASSMPFMSGRPQTSSECGHGASRPQTGSECGHGDSGQELCYVCHQRAKRNIPVSFAEERRQRDQLEDMMLQQYQKTCAAEEALKRQEKSFARRQESEKAAAYNLAAAEAKKTVEEPEFHPSYVFQRRALTPPAFIKQEQYLKDLQQQVNVKELAEKKRLEDEGFLERLEQVQLAEELAARKQQQQQNKAIQQEQYKRALSAQLKLKPLSPSTDDNVCTEPYFGKHDMNAEKLAEKRRKAHELYQEQIALAEQNKRDALLKRTQQQNEDDDVLKRAKDDLRTDMSQRYTRLLDSRRRLETDWQQAVELKRSRDLDQRHHDRLPSDLHVLEQCDKYRRCGQCRRRLNNRGESNVWRDTRYVTGTRIIV